MLDGRRPEPGPTQTGTAGSDAPETDPTTFVTNPADDPPPF
jgi:hypothetical protein